MYMLQNMCKSSFSSCTYLPDKNWRFKYFFANDLSKDELNKLLRKGWRKFGSYYFKPDCVECFDCLPLRVLTDEFKPSKSQRRIMRKASDVEVKFGPLRYSDEIFAMYEDHSRNRFDQDSLKEDFLTSFYSPSCPAIQSEFYLNGKLIAVGFLDHSSEALSSVYFIFNTDYDDLSLGTFGAIKEIEFALSLGLKYYYLGYYVEKNHSMSYKNKFKPNEKYNWHEKIWYRDI